MRPSCGGGPADAAVLRRQNNILEVSRDIRAALAPELYAELAEAMHYDHVRFLRGAEARDPATGHRRRVEVVAKRLYGFDGRGRLICGMGYADRVYDALTRRGFRVAFVDATPPGPRPDAFALDWDYLADAVVFTPLAGDAARVAAMLAGGETPDAALARRVKQDEVIRSVVRRVERRLGGVYRLPPGTGKSWMFAGLARLFHSAKLVFTVPDRDNLNKTVRHLTRYISGVGQVGDGRRKYGRVTVVTRDSLHLCQPDVDIMFVDEAHKYMADRAAGALVKAAPRALMFAFTATPYGRPDNADARMESIFGPIVYDMGWPEATALGLIAPIQVRWIPCDFPTNPAAGARDDFRKRHGLWCNDDRNGAIAAAARTLPAGEQTLIIAETITHLMQLRRFLPEFQPCYATHDEDQFKRFRRLGLVDDDFEPVTPAVRERMRRDFESGALAKVMSTKIWTTGVSFDGLPVVMRADGSQSVELDEQIPGRVSRVFEGKPFGVLYDCDDRFDAGFHKAALRRRRNYEEKQWPQTVAELIR